MRLVQNASRKGMQRTLARFSDLVMRFEVDKITSKDAVPPDWGQRL